MASSRSNIDVIISGTSASFEKAMANIVKSSKSAADGMGNFVSGIAKLGGAYLAVSGLSELGKQFVETSMAYEKMKASLTASVGADAMPDVWKGLQQFAKDTPYSLEQVQGAYTRMMNLGIKPSTDALKAYGNIVAATPNKELTDFVEAVADAVTGENERLKEFGIVGRKVGTDGKKIAYTFQGVTKEVDNNKDAINEYLISVSKQIAGGKAMELQAATLSGRMSALGDTFKQFQDDFMNKSGASGFLADAVGAITDGMDRLNLAMNSGELAAYWDSFLNYIQPVINVVTDLSNYFKKLDSDMASSKGGSFIAETWNTIVEIGKQVAETVMTVIQWFDEMGKNNGLKALWDAVVAYLLPIKQILDDLINAVSSTINDIVAKFTEWGEKLGVTKKDSDQFVTDVLSFFMKLPAGIAKVFKDCIQYATYFVKAFIAVFGTIGTVIANFLSGDYSSASFKKAFDDGNQYAIKLEKEHAAKLKANADDYAKSIADTKKTFDEARAKSSEAWSKAQTEREKQNNKREVDDIINNILVDSKKKQIAEEVKNTYKNLDKKTDEVYNKQFGGKGGNPSAAAGGASKKGGKNSQEAKDAKELSDYQQKLLDEQYRSGLITARKYYDETLKLKLEEIKASDDATKQQYQKNLDIINSSTASESDKKKAIADNTNLQSKMNNMSSKELAIRQEISLRLRDAQDEYKKNIQSIEAELNSLTLGGKTAGDVVNELADKYKILGERIKAEDAESGKNDYAKLERLKAITIAQAKVADIERTYSEAQAEVAAQNAMNQEAVMSGTMSAIQARELEIEAAQRLKDIRAETAAQELDIANKTPGYNKIALSNLREQAATAKTTQNALGENVQSILESAQSTASDTLANILSGNEEVLSSFKDLFKSILNDFNKLVANALTKNLFDAMFGAGNMGTAGGATSGSGLFGSIGGFVTNALGSFFGGAKAGGGIIGRNKFGLVGEVGGGGELVFSGSSPLSVLNAKQTQGILGQGGTNVNINVNTPDANSFRYSQAQMITETQRTIRRQFNRNS